MKLRPMQIAGLVGVVVFGSILIFTLAKPKRDPMVLPSGVDLRDLPSPDEILTPDPLAAAQSGADAPDDSAPDASSPGALAPSVEEMLAAGSERARGDLYCAGVLWADHRAAADVMSEAAQARRDALILLSDTGVAELISEGAADRSTAGRYADAHTDQALADYAAGTLRIPVDACRARAEELMAQTR
ncbi:MAG: hypothetical protein R3C52_09340 [Hyphomonadaceae bacterium]